MNCGPARRLCLPVLAPAGAWARAGEGGGRRVLREHFVLDHAGRTVLSECLAFDHACCLPHSAKRDSLRYAPFLFRRGCVFARAYGFVAFSAGGTLGQNVEAALRPRPRLRQGVIDFLDSLLIRGGNVLYDGRKVRFARG